MDAETIGKLEQPLSDDLVAFRDGPGKSRLAYVEGFEVINQANRIFGFGCWGVEHIGDPIISRFGDKTWYCIRVKVTVTGAESYTDVGVGIADRDTAEAHEMAVKGAATDGLKRALRNYGAQFGLELYDKANPQRNEQQTRQSAAHPPAPQQAQNRPPANGNGQRMQDTAKPTPAPQGGLGPCPVHNIEWRPSKKDGGSPYHGIPNDGGFCSKWDVEKAATTATQAQGAQKQDRGDRRIAVWLKSHGIVDPTLPIFKTVDAWLLENFNVSVADFAAAPAADRDKIMTFVSTAEVKAWIDEEKAALRS